MRGRKPKPRVTHKRDGTFRSDRHAGDVPDPGGVVNENPPDDLPDEAREFWRAHAPVLNAMEVGKSADETYLRQAAMQWYRLQKAMAEILENGGETYICEKTNNPKRHPAGITARDMEDRLAKWYAEVGLTPTSRERLAKKDAAGEHTHEDWVLGVA